MKITAPDIARALLELSKSMPDGQVFLKDVRNELSRSISGEALTVTLTTPEGSAPDLAEGIKQMVEKKTGKSVQIIEQKDASLIGGAVVKLGDQQIDFSLRGGLMQLTDSLRSHS